MFQRNGGGGDLRRPSGRPACDWFGQRGGTKATREIHYSHAGKLREALENWPDDSTEGTASIG